jgi:hypothetical protein
MEKLKKSNVYFKLFSYEQKYVCRCLATEKHLNYIVFFVVRVFFLGIWLKKIVLLHF